MKPISERERQAYSMRAQGSTYEEIGSALGVKAQTARTFCLKAEMKGMPPLPKRTQTQMLKVDGTEAAKLTGAKPDGGFDIEKFVEFAKAAGIPPRVVQALARRIMAGMGLMKVEAKKMALAEEIAKVQEIKEMILQFADPVAIAGTSLKDLSIAYGVFTDKALLLGGKPTAIIDINARRELDKLLPELFAEARRRGITIDASGTIVQEKVVVHEEVEDEQLKLPAA